MIVAAPSSPANAAELLELIDRLGGIDPARVRLQPLPGTATEDDLLRVVEVEKRRCELVDGTLVEKTMGFEEAMLAQTLGILLGNFVRPRRLGW